MNKGYSGNYCEQDEGQLPDPPENPEFCELDLELQTVIADRFERGIALSQVKDAIVRNQLLATQANNIRKQKERVVVKVDAPTPKRSRKPVRS